MRQICNCRSRQTLPTCADLLLIKSVLGGFHYLGTTEFINGPFFCTSKLISCVVTSAAEAESGAAFQNAQKGALFRNTLIELGYPATNDYLCRQYRR